MDTTNKMTNTEIGKWKKKKNAYTEREIITFQSGGTES